MSKPIKILLIVLISIIVVLGGVLSVVYLKGVNQKAKREVTPVTREKDEDTKEVENINTEIKNSEDLDLTDINGISNELDQIDMSNL